MGTVINMKLRLQAGSLAKYAQIVRRARNSSEIAGRGAATAKVLRWPLLSEAVGDSNTQAETRCARSDG